MKRFRISCVAVSIVAVAALFVFAAAASAGTRSKTMIKASPDAVSIGDTVTVSGRGFKPKSSFVLNVNDVKFATGTTNKRGRVRLAFTVPDGAWQALTLKVVCSGKNASTDLQVTDGVPNAADDSGINSDSGDIQDDTGDDPGSSDQLPEFSF